MRIPLIIVICLLLTSCGEENKMEKDLQDITAWMTGEFSSSEQAAADTSFFDISLTMIPIWGEDPDANWMYVEQAVSRSKRKPYRQRVYRIQIDEKRKIESKVYELPDPEKYIHAWENREVFETLTKEDLIERAGCSVYLRRHASGSFQGSTRANECKSQLYGAAYATSEVQVFEDRIISWDRGWDEAGEQVWGAESGGYIFVKK